MEQRFFYLCLSVGRMMTCNEMKNSDLSNFRDDTHCVRASCMCWLLYLHVLRGCHFILTIQTVGLTPLNECQGRNQTHTRT